MANELANGIDMDTTPEPWLWGLSEANSPEPAKPQSFEDLCERGREGVLIVSPLPWGARRALGCGGHGG